MLQCSQCDRPIKDGEQVAVWDQRSDGLCVGFVCQECAVQMEASGATTDVTEEMQAAKIEFEKKVDEWNS